MIEKNQKKRCVESAAVGSLSGTEGGGGEGDSTIRDKSLRPERDPAFDAAKAEGLKAEGAKAAADSEIMKSLADNEKKAFSAPPPEKKTQGA